MLALVACLAVLARCDAMYHDLHQHQLWNIRGVHEAARNNLERLLGQVEVEGLVDRVRPGQVHVAPHQFAEAKSTLEQLGLEASVAVEDIAAFIQDEQRQQGRMERSNTRSCSTASCPAPLTDNYMTLDQIESYLQNIKTIYNDDVTVTSIGKSVEGRDIWMAHVKKSGCSGGQKVSVDGGGAGAKIGYQAMRNRSVWIEGGLHAREWISPAVALYLLHRMLESCSHARAFDVYVVPMANPDGYRFTWNNNRLWRKNRRNNQGSSCMGVDLNRNWDAHYGVGASSNPCSETYKGAAPFSEPETLALSQAMQKVAADGSLQLVMSLHSYGQVLMYPWGWTTDPAPDTPAMKRLGEIFAEGAKQATGVSYSVVNSAGGFYYASGATDDWAKEKLATKYVYTLELRDKGAQGFQLSPNNIVPNGNEVWQGLIKMLYVIAPEKGRFRKIPKY